MIKIATLNVTKIEPKLKHPTIFEYFDRLAPGEGFEIINDHDPKPLYYTLVGERGNIFTWEYLENGPMYWRVQIEKKQQAHEHTIGAIAASDHRKAAVFKRLGIDFCCGGKRTLLDAAASVGMDEQELLEALANPDTEPLAPLQHDFNAWNVSFLIAYIINVHHQYIRVQGPIVQELAEKVALRHGNEHQELFELASGLNKFMQDLYHHIAQEEEELFPIVNLLTSRAEPLSDGGLRALIRHMEAEHAQAGDELRTFRTLTKDYQLPANACQSYIYLYQNIMAFEQDLFQHIHLENNVLFPKLHALT